MCNREFQDSREGFKYEPTPEDWAEYDRWCAEMDRDIAEHPWDGDNDEPWDGFRDDVEADADVLRMAGYGTDEDYGFYDYPEEY